MKWPILCLMISHGILMVLIFLSKKPKTDQHSKGDFVSIVRNTNPAICPVSLTLYYFKKFSIKSAFLLPSLKGRSIMSPLSYNTALRDLRKCLTKIGLDPAGFGEHSGRRGGTTADASAGASIDELRKMEISRHASSLYRLCYQDATRFCYTFSESLKLFNKKLVSLSIF